MSAAETVARASRPLPARPRRGWEGGGTRRAVGVTLVPAPGREEDGGVARRMAGGGMEVVRVGADAGRPPVALLPPLERLPRLVRLRGVLRMTPAVGESGW